MAVTFTPPKSKAMGREMYRMPAAMVKELEALAERKITTKSMLVREAIRRLLEAEKETV